MMQKKFPKNCCGIQKKMRRLRTEDLELFGICPKSGVKKVISFFLDFILSDLFFLDFILSDFIFLDFIFLDLLFHFLDNLGVFFRISSKLIYVFSEISIGIPYILKIVAAHPWNHQLGWVASGVIHKVLEIKFSVKPRSIFFLFLPCSFSLSPIKSQISNVHYYYGYCVNICLDYHHHCINMLI